MTFVRPDNFEAPKEAKLNFGELVQQFDATDAELRIAYARYIENPGDARYRRLDKTREKLISDFESALVALEGDMRLFPGEDRQDMHTEIIGTLLIDTTVKHDALLAEYTDEPVLTSEAVKNMRDQLIGCLEVGNEEHLGDNDSHEALTAHAMSHLNDLLSDDHDVVTELADKELESPKRRAARAAKRVLAETARVAVASAVTLAIIHKFKK